jgi:ABC-type antimicrobial peptide transport system permease subunit
MVAAQSWRSLYRRPLRSIVTSVGVALGVAVFVATSGWSSTVNAQVNQTFDELSATEIRISDTQKVGTDPLFAPTFNEDLSSLDGVVDGGQLWLAESGVAVERSAAAASSTLLPVVVASPGAIRAASARLGSGRLYDATKSDQTMVVLGPRAAQLLGIPSVVPGLGLIVAGKPVTVAGILATAGTATELASAVIVSPGSPYAARRQISAGEEAGLVRTEIGATSAVARALPYAVRPDDPSRVGVQVAPDATSLRSDVQGSLNGLALGAAGLALLLGGLGIMNSMLMAVTQRASEIGLRRALGGRPRDVSGQFLLEGTALGALGATLGVGGGVVLLIGIAAVNGWHAVLDPRLVWVALPVGTVLGLVSTLYPAWRAGRTAPAATLRQ